MVGYGASTAVHILCELGPVALMYIVNAIYGIAAGTWVLIFSTVVSSAVMLWAFRRVPIFPLIVFGLSTAFGTITLLTGDAVWVQWKVRYGSYVVFALGALIVLREFRRSR